MTNLRSADGVAFWLFLTLALMPVFWILWQLGKRAVQAQKEMEAELERLQQRIAGWNGVNRLMQEHLRVMKTVEDEEPYSEEWLVICPELARINAEIAAIHPEPVGASSAQASADYYAGLARGEFDVNACRAMMRGIIARASEIGDEATVARAEENLLALARFS